MRERSCSTPSRIGFEVEVPQSLVDLLHADEFASARLADVPLAQRRTVSEHREESPSSFTSDARAALSGLA